MAADVSNPFPSSVINVSSFPAAASMRIETTISEGDACLIELFTASCTIRYMLSFVKSERDDVSTSFCHEKRHFTSECFAADAHSELSSSMRLERPRSGGTRFEQMERSSSMHFLFPLSTDPSSSLAMPEVIGSGTDVSASLNCALTSLMHRV